jgi:hypothetical protein
MNPTARKPERQDPANVGPLIPSAELMGRLWAVQGLDVHARLRESIASWPGDRRGKVRLRLAALDGANRAKGGWR